MFGPAHGSRKRNALRLASSLTRGTTLGETDHAPNSPAHRARILPPPPHPKIPPKSDSTALRPTSQQYSRNPLPPVPLHSIRSAKAALPAAPIRRRRGSAILSLPQYALIDCRPLAAPPPLATFLWRRTAVSAATAGDVRVETHDDQILPRYMHSRLRPRAF